MARPFAGPNSVGHLINRQMGRNIHSFRKTIFKERLNIAKTLYKKDLISHFGCVNAIEFSEEGEWLISGKCLIYLFVCLFTIFLFVHQEDR